LIVIDGEDVLAVRDIVVAGTCNMESSGAGLDEAAARLDEVAVKPEIGVHFKHGDLRP
jgi:3-deoxy-D-manno-octulosonic acid (KDO) 8-phosphate synthase